MHHSICRLPRACFGLLPDIFLLDPEVMYVSLVLELSICKPFRIMIPSGTLALLREIPALRCHDRHYRRSTCSPKEVISDISSLNCLSLERICFDDSHTMRNQVNYRCGFKTNCTARFLTLSSKRNSTSFRSNPIDFCLVSFIQPLAPSVPKAC